MKQHPELPTNQKQRLTKFKKLWMLDALPESLFDQITTLASEICDVPIALISLVEENRQWFKSNKDLEGASKITRELAVYAQTILHNELMERWDETHDNGFQNNLLLTSASNICFYARVPITMPDGENIGMLCVIDNKPNHLSLSQKAMLNNLTKIVASALISIQDNINEINANANVFSNIVDSHDDAIISKSTDSIVLTWNLGAERIFGYRADEMIGHSAIKLVPPNRVREEEELLAKIRNKQHIQFFKTQRLTKSGVLIDVSVTLSPIEDLNGKVIGISKVARDITAQKEAEVALDQAHERLRVTMNSIGDGVITTDNKGNCNNLHLKSLKPAFKVIFSQH